MTMWMQLYVVAALLTCGHARVHTSRHYHKDVGANYLRALKLSLTGELLQTDTVTPEAGAVHQLKRAPFNESLRQRGVDWPLHGLTMVGRARLDNIEQLLRKAVKNGVPGDFVECGVWRGGSSLYARAVLDVLREPDRVVHLVDSFQGLPVPTQSNDVDSWSRMHFLRVPLEEVQRPFRQLGLLDDGVAFHKGFFQNSLPVVRQQLMQSNRPIAVLRMDGDMYESTMDILYNLYDLVSVGGCVIIDDYTIVYAKRAVHEFLDRHGIVANFVSIDESSAYFCKQRHVAIDNGWYIAFNKNRTQPTSAAVVS